MTSLRLVVGATALLLWPGPSSAGFDAWRIAAADVPSPSAPAAEVPSPRMSPGVLSSPGKAPLLPPEGLPTAPPPDAIKPIEPQAEPKAPKPDPVADDGVPGEPGFRYLAVISGACDALVVDDHTVPECADKLLNVDFGNGRVAFLFSGREGATNVVTTFSGGVSSQPDERAYRLTIDRVSTTRLADDGRPVTVIANAEGLCTMQGDPTHESTRFECRVQHAGKDTTARFKTVGTPEVYAGTPPARERSLGRLAFGNQLPKTTEH